MIKQPLIDHRKPQPQIGLGKVLSYAAVVFALGTSLFFVKTSQGQNDKTVASPIDSTMIQDMDKETELDVDNDV